MSRVKKVIQQFYWLITFFGFSWGQSFLATLVTPHNFTKMLRNLTFVVQFASFSIRPKNVFAFWRIFWATFVRKSNFWLFFVQLLSNFLRKYGKLFGKSRATSGKPYSSQLFIICKRSRNGLNGLGRHLVQRGWWEGERDQEESLRSFPSSLAPHLTGLLSLILESFILKDTLFPCKGTDKLSVRVVLNTGK